MVIICKIQLLYFVGIVVFQYSTHYFNQIFILRLTTKGDKIIDRAKESCNFW